VSKINGEDRRLVKVGDGRKRHVVFLEVEESDFAVAGASDCEHVFVVELVEAAGQGQGAAPEVAIAQPRHCLHQLACAEVPHLDAVLGTLRGSHDDVRSHIQALPVNIRTLQHAHSQTCSHVPEVNRAIPATCQDHAWVLLIEVKRKHSVGVPRSVSEPVVHGLHTCLGGFVVEPDFAVLAGRRKLRAIAPLVQAERVVVFLDRVQGFAALRMPVSDQTV
jgi:hypothetical protein